MSLICCKKNIWWNGLITYLLIINARCGVNFERQVTKVCNIIIALFSAPKWTDRIIAYNY